MKILNKIRTIYSFNEVERDKWIHNISKAIPNDAKVLDVGAGSCPYRSFFSHCEYMSHDFAQLKPGQLRQNQNYTKLDFVSDVCHLPILENTFDVVICTEVIEHVPEPIQAVREILRVLKPGGMLFLTAPLGSGLHQEPFHFYGGYTPHWYKKFLPEAGFVDITIEPNRGFFSHYGQEGVRFVRMLAPWKGLNYLLWLPLWLLCLPCCLLLPFLTKRLDQLDKHKGFTIGYHVTAIKS